MDSEGETLMSPRRISASACASLTSDLNESKTPLAQTWHKGIGHSLETLGFLAHEWKVVGSNPTPATKFTMSVARVQVR
jgi:hypothetical protein